MLGLSTFYGVGGGAWGAWGYPGADVRESLEARRLPFPASTPEVFGLSTFYMQEDRGGPHYQPSAEEAIVDDQMRKAKSKDQALKLLETENYVVISDLGVVIGGDRVRVMYGVAWALRYLEVQELLEDAQKARSLVEGGPRAHRGGRALWGRGRGCRPRGDPAPPNARTISGQSGS